MASVRYTSPLGRGRGGVDVGENGRRKHVARTNGQAAKRFARALVFRGWRSVWNLRLWVLRAPRCRSGASGLRVLRTRRWCRRRNGAGGSRSFAAVGDDRYACARCCRQRPRRKVRRQQRLPQRRPQCRCRGAGVGARRKTRCRARDSQSGKLPRRCRRSDSRSRSCCVPVTKRIWRMPAVASSSTTWWTTGRRPTGSISLDRDLVVGRSRVPRPATGTMALAMFMGWLSKKIWLCSGCLTSSRWRDIMGDPLAKEELFP